MALDPAFLASLRRTMRAELLILMVQLEQVVPGWWPSLHDLADQLGTDRSTLNNALVALDRKGLIRRASISNTGGTFIWWVQQHPDAVPPRDSEPHWLVRDQLIKRTTHITITGRARWAARNHIAYSTLRGFLSGHQKTLAGRWTLQATPFDNLNLQPSDA